MKFLEQNHHLTMAQHKEVSHERHILYSDLKRKVKQEAMDADSDDDGLGYHDSSSDNEEEIEYSLTETIEQQSQVMEELNPNEIRPI